MYIRNYFDSGAFDSQRAGSPQIQFRSLSMSKKILLAGAVLASLAPAAAFAQSGGAAAGATTGAVGGAIVGGPVGAAVGGVAGVIVLFEVERFHRRAGWRAAAAR